MSVTTTPPPRTDPAPPADDDVLYEVVDGQIVVDGRIMVDGQIVEVPSMGVYAGWIASILNQTLGTFVRTQGLGRLVVEVLFRVAPAPKIRRRPDLAFVSYERWPRGKRVPEDAAWDVVPELAIEVVSPTNLAEDLLVKVDEYFQAGISQVWVVYPAAAQVHVHESTTYIRVLRRGDELDGGPLLPGFRLSLAELFEDEAEPA